MDTIRGALLAVVDSSAISPLTRNCVRGISARVHLDDRAGSGKTVR